MGPGASCAGLVDPDAEARGWWMRSAPTIDYQAGQARSSDHRDHHQNARALRAACRPSLSEHQHSCGEKESNYELCKYDHHSTNMIFKNAFFATMIFATLTLPIGEELPANTIGDGSKKLQGGNAKGSINH